MGTGQYLIQTAFNGGEWTPRLIGQIQLKKYREACLQVENWNIYPHGPAHTRPGFYYIGELSNNSKVGRLTPFIYSNVTAYILVWEEGKIRFISGQAFVTSGGGIYSITNPYTEDDLPYLKFAQSFDVQYVVRRTHTVHKLLRYASDSWYLEDVAFNDGPYMDPNSDGSVHLQPSAVSGTGVTLTASGRSTPSSIDTTGGTPAVSEAGFTATTPYVGFLFTPSLACQVNSVSLYIDTAPGSPINVEAHVYLDASGSPTGSALGVASAQSVSATGIYTWSMSTIPNLSAANDYWVVWHATSTDAATKLSTVAHDALYGFGTYSSLAGLTDNVAAKTLKTNIAITDISGVSVFNPLHVGSIWRLRHQGPTSEQTFTAAGQVSPVVLLRGKFTVDATPTIPTSSAGSYFDGEIALQSSTDGVNYIDVASFFSPTDQEFLETKGYVWYRLYSKRVTAGQCTVTISQAEQWGTIKITSYTSSSQVVGDVLFPFGDTTPTSYWREGAWSPYRGYPDTVLFHSNRLWFGRDATIWGSWVGDYENFNPDGDTDDAAVSFSPTQLNNSLVWMESLRGLMLGSLGEEARVTGSNEKPITQSSIQCEVQTSIGSAQYPEPVRIGQAALYVQTDRRKLREFVYDLAADGFKSPDLSARAEHITVGGIYETCFQKNPSQIIYSVRGDGVLLGMTYYREEDVLAWNRITSTNGIFESCAVKPSSAGITQGYDELWVIVRRTINGETKRYIELMANHDATTSTDREVTDFICLDSSCEFLSPGTLTLTGLAYLEGQLVTAVADGIPLTPQLVSGGSITLDIESFPSVVQVGLAYTCTLATYPFDMMLNDGSSVGRQKMTYRMTMRLLESLGGKVGPDLDHLQDILYRTPQNSIGQQIPLFTGIKQFAYNGNSMDQVVYVVQDKPLPMTVCSLGILMETND